MDTLDRLSRLAFWSLVFAVVAGIVLGLLLAGAVSATVSSDGMGVATPVNGSSFLESLPKSGDDYVDVHPIEFHGLVEIATTEYREATVAGENTDSVELVGFVE